MRVVEGGGVDDGRGGPIITSLGSFFKELLELLGAGSEVAGVNLVKGSPLFNGLGGGDGDVGKDEAESGTGRGRHYQ